MTQRLNGIEPEPLFAQDTLRKTLPTAVEMKILKEEQERAAQLLEWGSTIVISRCNP